MMSLFSYAVRNIIVWAMLFIALTHTRKFWQIHSVNRARSCNNRKVGIICLLPWSLAHIVPHANSVKMLKFQIYLDSTLFQYSTSIIFHLFSKTDFKQGNKTDFKQLEYVFRKKFYQNFR